MKQNIGMLNLMIFLFYFSSCSKPEQIRLIGFAKKEDSIVLKIENDVVFSFRSNENCEGKICHFNRLVKINKYQKGKFLKIEVISENEYLMDTVIRIQPENKKPFISFVKFIDNSDNQRSIFVGNEESVNFLKE